MGLQTLLYQNILQGQPVAFLSKNSFPGTRQMPQGLRYILLLQKTRTWPPTPMSEARNHLWTSAPGVQCFLLTSLGTRTHEHIPTKRQLTLSRANARIEVPAREPESGNGQGSKHCFSNAIPKGFRYQTLEGDYPLLFYICMSGI